MENQIKKINNGVILELSNIIPEFNNIEWAEDMAQSAHLGQRRRNGMPYIIHPKNTQLRARELGYNKKIQMLCLLHDVIEDSNDNSLIMRIKSKIGPELYVILELLSHDDDVSYNNYLLNLVTTSDIAFKVKMLDMYDNLLDNPTKQQFDKYYNAILFLLNNDVNPNIIPDKIYNILRMNRVKKVSEQIYNVNNVILEKDDAKDKSDPTDDKPESKGNDPFADDGVGKFDKNDLGDGDKSSEESGDDEKNSIIKFTELSNKIKKIKYQNSDEMPNVDVFDNIDIYNEYFIGESIKGSLILACPTLYDIYDESYFDFINDIIINKIIKTCDKAIDANKKIVYIGQYGNPVNEDSYQNNEQGIIAKILSDKYGDDISFDTWIPNEYKSFISNDKIWSTLKKRTEMSGRKIKAALYLYMLLLHGSDKLTNSLFDEKVDVVLQSWNIKSPNKDLSYFDDFDNIKNFLYPELKNKPQNEASYIIKSYYHLLMKDLIVKIIRYEKLNKISIVVTTPEIAWRLSTSVKNIDLILANKDDK